MKYFGYLFIIGLFGCQQSLENQLDIVSSKDLISNRSDIVSSNGMLTFASEEAFMDYYLYIDSMANNSDDPDSTLELIEQSLSFLSYRSINYIDSVSQEELTRYYNNEYIPDINMQSIFNKYGEYKVGSDYFTYFAPNRLYRIKNNDYNTLVKFRSIQRGSLLPPVELYNENVEIVSGGGIEIFIDDDKGDPIIPRSDDDEIKLHLGTDKECGFETGKKLTAEFYLKINNQLVPTVGYWTITWGDGTVDTYNNVSKVEELVHIYPDYDDYYDLEIYINYNHPEHGFTNFTYTKDDIPIWRDCRFEEYHEEDEVELGNRKLVSKIWYNLAFFNHSIHAYSHCWEKYNGTEYRREKGELDVDVDINWFQNFYWCGELSDHESEHDDCNNCKRRQAMKLGPDNSSWSPSLPSSSTHRLEDGGIILHDARVLNPCD